MSPYNLNPIANQFQAMNDLAEFDPLDLAVLDNTAKQQKNKIGYQRLKQGASQGKGVEEVAMSLYDERDKAAQELAARQAETQGFQNLYASMDGAMSDVMGFEQPQTSLNPWVSRGQGGWLDPNQTTAPRLATTLASGAEPVFTPPGTNQPSQLDLTSRYGELASQQANLQREYASDTGYNSAMAAVREALGKAPAVPTLQKPQLTKEDQALVALAGIFGGFQNMPRALQGALAGAQQRAEIENQQLQNKFQQEQTAYQRQLQGLQGVAETEAERRAQEQKTLDKNYQMRYGQIAGEMAKIPYQVATLGQKKEEIGIKKEEVGIKKEAAAAKAANIRQQVTKKEQLQLLNNEIKAWNRMVAIMTGKPEIDKKDVTNMTNQRIRAIRRLTAAGLSIPQDYFYIPPAGMNPTVAMAQSNRVFNAGVDLAIDAATGKLPVIPLDPQIEKNVKFYQGEIDKLRRNNEEINRKNSVTKNQFIALRKQLDNKEITQSEYNKAFDQLTKEKNARIESKKSNDNFIKQYEQKLNEIASGGEVLPDPRNYQPTGKIGKNIVDTPLGTIEFLDA
jgi:hypothetical protein